MSKFLCSIFGHKKHYFADEDGKILVEWCWRCKFVWQHVYGSNAKDYSHISKFIN